MSKNIQKYKFLTKFDKKYQVSSILSQNMTKIFKNNRVKVHSLFYSHGIFRAYDIYFGKNLTNKPWQDDNRKNLVTNY